MAGGQSCLAAGGHRRLCSVSGGCRLSSRLENSSKFVSKLLQLPQVDHFVTFSHLPDDQTDVTIKIYSIDGVLVRKLESMANENQYLQWDLRNNSNLPVASGPYVAHVNTAHGERILKLYIIQRNQVVQYY